MKCTQSLCPECYDIIPALVMVVEGKVWMSKRCVDHGYFTAMVESNPFWYYLCEKWSSDVIYPGYFIDVTDRCNIECKYCYHDNTGGDRPIKEILAEAEAYKEFAPFALIGGEPTLHPDGQ